jgi:hypothetical protein
LQFYWNLAAATLITSKLVTVKGHLGWRISFASHPATTYARHIALQGIQKVGRPVLVKHVYFDVGHTCVFTLRHEASLVHVREFFILLLAHPASTVIHVHNTHPSTINSIVINLAHAENDVLASLIQDIDCAGLVVLVLVDNSNAVLLAGFLLSCGGRICRTRDGR